ncbi:peptidylprolyl isomerase [Candidatus Margulisiibacteriota bacterium]
MMKNISKIIIYIMVLSLISGLSFAAGKVIVTVGEEKITIDDFKERLEELPPQFRGYYSSEQGKSKFLDQLIQERLLYLDARAKRMDSETEVKEAVDRARKNIIVAYYVNKVLKNVVITDKELKDFYNANKNKYLAPARVRASHILVDTKQKADEILAKLTAGADFETLAKEESQAPSAKESADVGWFEKGQMVKPFESAAFALQVGETSLPVKTQYGYHIIRVTDKAAQQQKSFEQVKATIREELLREAQNKKLDRMVSKLKDKINVNIDQAALGKF